MNGQPDLSICIVNHKTPTLTINCLRSIATTAGNLSIEVIVTNNTQDAFHLAKLTYGSGHDRVRLIQNETPLGFASNQTNMMQIAAGRLLVALNSDTEVQAGMFQEMIRFMDAHPRCGILGPRVLHTDESLQPTCRNFPSPINHFLEASGIWKRLRRLGWLYRHFYLAHQHDIVMTPDWITGVCMMTTSDVFRKVGGMNGELFPEMFAEDLEWCWRVRKASYEVYFDPEAVILHHESASPLHNRALKTYQSFYRFCAMHYSKTFCAGIRIATILALAPKAILARNAETRAIYASILKIPVR